ncbi:unnamed protein product [Paramecium primaurelia]|uniref:Reverse transcriptase domain-containing protein n=1 Tax=Paramecium primaurelia TaxID=5886 RepID=A0A8S1QEH0_PARPR|nr:unnamed protein product [Paramecium primaurelia]
MHQNAYTNSFTQKFNFNLGVDQGSLLEPFLFDVYFDLLVDTLDRLISQNYLKQNKKKLKGIRHCKDLRLIEYLLMRMILQLQCLTYLSVGLLNFFQNELRSWVYGEYKIQMMRILKKVKNFIMEFLFHLITISLNTGGRLR